MKKTFKVRECLKELDGDSWRASKENRFSKELGEVNEVLWNDHLDDEEKQVILGNWLQRHQPCMFGRIAASKGWLHFCVLSEKDLRKSDQFIKNKIHNEVLAWKRRSISPQPGVSTPAHGFILLVASSWIANAAPDKRLRRLAEGILTLWACPATKEPAGKVYWETLYLENPANQTITQFEFSVDFFAAQGDGRWWYDHRIPGGFAFTANSVGHMMRYQEWYHSEPDQTFWSLRTAIDTINRAKDIYGTRATSLRRIESGPPFDVSLPCPFPEEFKQDKLLVGVDWTRYEGFLHTDHSIRPEFFYPSATMPAAVAARKYELEFAYLYDKRAKDFKKFITGVTISAAEVEEVIGPRSEWFVIKKQPRVPARAAAKVPAGSRKAQREQIAQARKLIAKSRKWRLTREEIRDALLK